METPPIPAPSPRSPLAHLRRLVRMTSLWRVHVTITILSLFRAPGDNNGNKGVGTLMGREQRRHPRISLTGVPVHVTDGCLFANALIGNISASGLCLRNLPDQLYRGAGRLTVFSSDDPGMPVVQIEPRWQSITWGGKTIGAAVVDNPNTWKCYFVHTAERDTA